MTGRFDGKVVLVASGGWTGPDDYAIGIGAGIAQHLATEGAKVAVYDLSPENAERTLAAIRKDGGEGIAVIGDMRKDEDNKRAVEETVAHFGQLDVLVNNNTPTGSPDTKTPAEYVRGTLEEFDYSWNVNYRSNLVLARYAVEHLPRGGSIVNIGSVFGAVDPIPGGYAMGKRAIAMVATPTMAAEYGPKGIRVNSISVGYVWNTLTQKSPTRLYEGQTVEEYRQDRAETLTVLGFDGDAFDVGKAVAFLASDDARWITGHDLLLDGGYALVPAFEVMLGKTGVRGWKKDKA